MADYYPLIARAIAGLDPSAPGESRRALYERARAALIAQLRSVQPPLSESEITRERLSLEEAVRKVESEAAPRARDASRSGGDRVRAGDAFRATARPNAKPGEPVPPPSTSQPSTPQQPLRPRPPSPPQQRNERPPLGQEGRPQRSLCADAPRPPPSSQPQVPMQDPQLPPTRERSGAPRRGPDNSAPQAPGVRGFRDIAADGDDLVRRAAQASRAARKTYANVPSPSPEFDRLEPSMENRGADPDAPYSYDESAAGGDRYWQQSPQPALTSRPTPHRDQ